jgi:hypothetical protein
MAAVGRLVLAPYAATAPSFVLAAFGALFVYAGLVWLLDRRALLQARSIVPHEAAAAAPEATPELALG